MATSKETVAFILEQLGDLDVRARAMFGEYGMYCDEKFAAIIADDNLYLKATSATDGMEEAPPYPGASMYRLVDADVLEDRERLQEIVQATADALPAPPPKKPRRSTSD